MFNFLKPKLQGGIGDLFGGSDAGSSGAAQQQQFNQKAIDELKRQFNITQENVQPFIDAGTGALPGVQSSATVGGLDDMLRQIMSTNTFGGLVDERQRAVEGQLAAGGLTRSGAALTEAARVPTDLALALESMLTGRNTNLAGSGLSAATGLGQIGQANASQISGLLSNSGAAASQGAITDAQSEAQGAQNLVNTAVTVGSLFFSDPSLKENVEKVGEVHGLDICQWDWGEKTKGTIIEKCGTLGFMADQVKDKFPQFVSDFCGFMVIDYPALLDHLEAA